MSPRRGWTLGGTLLGLALLAAPAPARAGWVIDQVTRGGGEARQQVLVQANRMKTLVLEADGRPALAFVLDLQAGTISQVDYAQRTYATAPLQEWIAEVQGAQRAAGSQMADAMKQMQEAMKEMPPEQRQMMEQMMRQRMGQPGGGAPAECREPRVEVRATGETATVAGFAATRHDVVTDGRPSAQVWLAASLTAWRELDPTRLQRFAAEMAKLAACSPGAGGPAGGATWRTVQAGYPVRVLDPSGMVVEVVRAERRDLPVAEFQPPAGFARRTLQEMLGR